MLVARAQGPEVLNDRGRAEGLCEEEGGGVVPDHEPNDARFSFPTISLSLAQAGVRVEALAK